MGHGNASANAILELLPVAEFEYLCPFLTRVRLVATQRLIESGQSAEHVFFLEEGLALMMAAPYREGTNGGWPREALQDGNLDVQVAMIGREGIVGGLALLDASSAAFSSVVVQIPGQAMRIQSSELRRCLLACPTLREACLRFVQLLTRQIMANAASNARGTLGERCARWLLMAHERVEGDDVPITHEALSAMLGVRRSGVTVATTALQKAGLITASRGRIRVLDRPGLQAAAGWTASQAVKKGVGP